ncbi:MAG: YihY/virulence factor BrkB family protein [Proteobacteria bacterium]|nr:YihY/virulence factor BrkB family protein [Pseudomonadota bacterium]
MNHVPDPLPPLDLTPEGRRREALRWAGGLDGALGPSAGPLRRTLEVLHRVWVGVYHDGFIHAGNLAYMSILALFPFIITMGAIYSAVGEEAERLGAVHQLLAALPPVVAHVLEPVARDVVAARHGWLLWAGALIGLWTVSSLIETIRDILHRAYGVMQGAAFWRYRLFSVLLIVLAVVLLLASLYLQVAITTVQAVIAARFPDLARLALPLALTRLVPGLVLFASLFVLFLTLTPAAYRSGLGPKWPGALLVSVWWLVVAEALPRVLAAFFHYDLTYGSLAGVMIALFFFWLVGLGMVTGAELNAALAQSVEERDMLGQADNRARAARKRREDRA